MDETKHIGATMNQSDGDKMSKNTAVGSHANQKVGGGQKMFALSRVFVAVVTKNNAMPMPDGNSFWVVQGADGKPALEPVRQSLLAVPTNVVLSISLEDCSGLLFYVRNVLMKDMTPFSGIQVNVVHTEAVYDADKGTINTEMSLYPTQYIPMSAMSVQQTPDSEMVPASDNVVPNSSDPSVEVTPDDTFEEAAQAVEELVAPLSAEESADNKEGAGAEDVKEEKEEGTATE